MKVSSKLLFVVLLTVSMACRKSGSFSDTPFLEYRSHAFENESGTNRKTYTLTVYFTDGDGDIGLLDNTPLDSCNENAYNFLIRYFEQVGGVYEEVLPVDSCLPFHNIIPNITPEGQNKTLEGDIIAAFPYSGLPQNSTDSIKFEFVLIDRAGNRSPAISSGAIALEE